MVIMEQVESTSIKSIGWGDNKLYIRFKSSDRLYCYQDIKEEFYKSFLAAPSKGKFFYENIKNKFSYFVVE